MNKRNGQSGFTLVELAIVVTIIGILTAGALEGHEILQSSRVNATVSQITAIEVGVGNFNDFFGGKPGDIPQPQVRLPNYPTDSRGISPQSNGYVGVTNWGTGGFLKQIPVDGMAPLAPTIGDETELFWTQLLYAGLITGVTNDGLMNKTVPQWGVTHPAASIGGGFVVGYDDSAPLTPGAPVAASFSGLVYAIEAVPNTDLGTTSGTQPMTPGRAAHLDRKMDDGKPYTGIVRAYGVTASCFQGATTNSYDESVVSNDCGILIYDAKNN